MENVEPKQIGRDSMILIGKILSKRLTKDEIYIAIMELDEKYPIPGHNPPLTKFQYQSYRRIQERKISDNGIEYLTHLQPMNFKEAAEMYAQYVPSELKTKITKRVKQVKQIKQIDRKMLAAGEEVPF